MTEEAKAVPASRSRREALLRPTESGLWQMIRFAIVGAVATAVDYAVLLGLYVRLHLSHVPSVAAGYAAGLIVCYLLSIAWIFPHRNINDKRVEFAVFMIIGAIGLVLTEIVVDLTLRVMGMYPGVRPHVSEAMRISLAKMIAVILVFFFNFWARKVTMFRRPCDRNA